VDVTSSCVQRCPCLPTQKNPIGLMIDMLLINPLSGLHKANEQECAETQHDTIELTINRKKPIIEKHWLRGHVQDMMLLLLLCVIPLLIVLLSTTATPVTTVIVTTTDRLPLPVPQLVNTTSTTTTTIITTTTVTTTTTTSCRISRTVLWRLV